jgi:hypothetical protein
MLTPTTTSRGMTPEVESIGEIMGINWIIAIRRKYKLVIFVNSYIKESGKKFHLLYLFVFI